MANRILPNLSKETSKINELIYFGTLLCETLEDLEIKLKTKHPGDFHIVYLYCIKSRWVQIFNELNTDDNNES